VGQAVRSILWAEEQKNAMNIKRGRLDFWYFLLLIHFFRPPPHPFRHFASPSVLLGSLEGIPRSMSDNKDVYTSHPLDIYQLDKWPWETEKGMPNCCNANSVVSRNILIRGGKIWKSRNYVISWKILYFVIMSEAFFKTEIIGIELPTYLYNV
jgi:hypothetical protein